MCNFQDTESDKPLGWEHMEQRTHTPCDDNADGAVCTARDAENRKVSNMVIKRHGQ